MGIRLASLRRQTNVVMAPACTYLNFELDFSSIIECCGFWPPISLLHAVRDKCTRRRQLRLMYVQIYLIRVTLLTDKHVNRSEIFGSNPVVLVSNLKTSQRTLLVLLASVHSSLIVVGHLVVSIMNNSASMGDEQTAMGLQNIDMPTFEGRLAVKRSPPAAIDLLTNFEREMCRNGTSFQQDCEEFLKMMATNAEKTSPAVLTNGGSQYAGDESPEHDLLQPELEPSRPEPEVDHMPALQLQSVESDASSYADTIEEGRRRCLQMERRVERLARRLKLQQAKVYGVHASEQISGLLDFCRCKFSDAPAAATNSGRTANTPMDVYLKRLKRCSDQSCVPQNSERFLHYFGSGTKESHKARNITSSVAPKFGDDLHEHIEKISGQLQAQVKAITSDFDSDVTASSSGNDSLDEESPLTPETMEDRFVKIPLSKRALWRWLRHRASIAYRLSWLQSHMSALEYTIRHYTEIHKKLRNAKGPVLLRNEPGAVAAAAVATSAAPTTIAAAAAAAATAAAAVAPTTKNGAGGGGAAHSIVLNGFHGSLAAAAVDSGEAHHKRRCANGGSSAVAALTSGVGGAGHTAAAVADSAPRLDAAGAAAACSVTSDVDEAAGGEEACSRARPLLRSKFRRRNVIRRDAWSGGATTGAGSGAAGARKFASVRCECVPPATCVLCVRRGPGVDLSSQHVYANLLPVQSKIALLEPTYHPVLSFPTDVSVSTHISALLNSDDVLDVCAKTIENRTAAQMPTKRHYSNYKTTEEIRRANSEGLEFKRRKKYAKRQPNNSQAVPFGRSQLSKQRHSKLEKTLSSLRKRRRKRLRSKRPVGQDNGLDESADEGLYYKKEDVYSSQPGSPHSSHSSTVKDPIRRKRGQSYDIDNFIIPPNSTPAMVASKPQYKEILIPRWTIVEEKPLSSAHFNRNLLQAHIIDDLSDEIIIKLHEIMEQSERKKFRTNSTRNRSRKRTDSCPETSEANTPERMASPVPSNADNDSVLMTPTSNVSISFASAIPTNPTTNSSTSKAKIPPLKLRTSMDCDNSSVTGEPSSSVELVTPYEIREFPLSDDAFKEMLTTHLGRVEEFDADDESTNDSKAPENEGRRKFPFTESTPSDSEDPDDPDWMLDEKDEEKMAADC